jgi:hypothetical protein
MANLDGPTTRPTQGLAHRFETAGAGTGTDGTSFPRAVGAGAERDARLAPTLFLAPKSSSQHTQSRQAAQCPNIADMAQSSPRGEGDVALGVPHGGPPPASDVDTEYLYVKRMVPPILQRRSCLTQGHQPRRPSGRRGEARVASFASTNPTPRCNGMSPCQIRGLASKAAAINPNTSKTCGQSLAQRPPSAADAAEWPSPPRARIHLTGFSGPFRNQAPGTSNVGSTHAVLCLSRRRRDAGCFLTHSPRPSNQATREWARDQAQALVGRELSSTTSQRVCTPYCVDIGAARHDAGNQHALASPTSTVAVVGAQPTRPTAEWHCGWMLCHRTRGDRAKVKKSWF